MATDLEVVKILYITTGSTGLITVGSFTKAKGAIVRYCYDVDGAPGTTTTTHVSAGMAFADLADSSGVAFHGNSEATGGMNVSSHRGPVAQNDDVLWVREDNDTASGVLVYEANLILTATDIKFNVVTAEAGHRFEVLVFTGDDVSAKSFSEEQSDKGITGLSFTTNLGFGCYVSAEDNIANTSFARLHFGCFVGPTILQHGIIGDLETPEARLDSDNFIATPPSSSIIGEVTAIAATSITWTGSGGNHFTGLLLDTGGEVSLKTLSLDPDDFSVDDEVALPNAGFDDVELIMSIGGNNDFDLDDTTICGVTWGSATTAADQSCMDLNVDSSGTENTFVTGSLVRVTAVANTFEGEIDEVSRTPTMTLTEIPTTSGAVRGFSFLYVEGLAPDAADEHTYMMM